MSNRLLTLAPLAAMAFSLYAVDLPVWSEGPGPVREVVPRIDVEGTRTYDPRGKFLLTTVSLDPLTVFEVLPAMVDPDRQVVAEREVLPRGETDREYERRTRGDMDESKLAAIDYALRRVTDYPDERGRGVLVARVLSGSPADGKLLPGDIILRAGGRIVTDVDHVGDAIDRAGPGGILELQVEDADGRRTIRLRPTTLDGSDPVIGVLLIPAFPVEVRIESGDVGGPSAGLMWALGLVDVLSPGDLTAGRTIAGTGAIDLEGDVLPIGGIGHKVLAAERAGAEIFLLPRDNLAEARSVGAEIRLVPVSTIDQALGFLERGGT